MIFLARSQFLWLVGATNEPIGLIIVYYMFKYSFRIKITLPESLRSQKSDAIMVDAPSANLS